MGRVFSLHLISVKASVISHSGEFSLSHQYLNEGVIYIVNNSITIPWPSPYPDCQGSYMMLFLQIELNFSFCYCLIFCIYMSAFPHCDKYLRKQTGLVIFLMLWWMSNNSSLREEVLILAFSLRLQPVVERKECKTIRIFSVPPVHIQSPSKWDCPHYSPFSSVFWSPPCVLPTNLLPVFPLNLRRSFFNGAPPCFRVVTRCVQCQTSPVRSLLVLS